MASTTQYRADIFEAFDLLVGQPHLQGRVAWPGAEYRPEDHGRPDDESVAPWARVDVQESSRRRATLGAKGSPTSRRRTEGSLVVQVFDGLGKGEARAMELVDHVRAAFEDTTHGEAQFGTSGPPRALQSGDWFQVTLAVPFFADVADS